MNDIEIGIKADSLKRSSIHLRPLTIFMGKNNPNISIIAQCIYMLFHPPLFLPDKLIRQFKSNKTFQLQMEDYISDRISNGLNYEVRIEFRPNFFKGLTKMGVENPTDFFNILSGAYEINSRQRAFFPVFRSGLIPVIEDLSIPKNQLMKKRSDTPQNRKFSQPVLDFIASLERWIRQYGKEPQSPTLDLIASIMGGRPVSKDIDGKRQVIFRPEKADAPDLPLYLISSTAASLLPLYLFLCTLKKIDRALIIIEEPETNIPEESLQKIALLIVRLIRNRHKVIVTTQNSSFFEKTRTFVRQGDKDNHLNISELSVHRLINGGGEIELMWPRSDDNVKAKRT